MAATFDQSIHDLPMEVQTMRSFTAPLSAIARTVPRTIYGAAVEIGWIATHLATYPLGLRRDHPLESAPDPAEAGHPYRLDRHGPLRRGLLVGNIEAARTPILLVHGIIDNHSVFGPLRRALHKRGFGRTLTFSYNALPADLREPAAELRDVIAALVSEAGYERIHVVGHSLGGLVARYAVQRLGADRHVHTLVTLGTPHRGTEPARWIPLPVVRQLRPDSEILTELAGPAPGCATRIVAIWSDFDEVIHPSENARLEHPDLVVRNVGVRGIGHLSLPIHSDVVREISTALIRLDEHGEPLSERVGLGRDTESTR